MPQTLELHGGLANIVHTTAVDNNYNIMYSVTWTIRYSL